MTLVFLIGIFKDFEQLRFFRLSTNSNSYESPVWNPAIYKLLSKKLFSVNGGWSPWVMKQCTRQFCGGHIFDWRNCDRPRPMFGGDNCEGQSRIFYTNTTCGANPDLCPTIATGMISLERHSYMCASSPLCEDLPFKLKNSSSLHFRSCSVR